MVETTKVLLNKYKDKRRSLPSDKTRPNKNKRNRPIEVQYRFGKTTNLGEIFPNWAKWTKHHNYRTVEEATQAINNLNRKGVFEYRLKPT